MGVGHVQGNATSSASSVTSASLVLGAAPTTGNLVVVEFFTVAVSTNLLVKDANNNTYTNSAASPRNLTQGTFWQAYLLSAPANASATINFTWTTGSGYVIFAEEFSIAGGTVAFDKEASANGGPGTTINTPTITPTNANSLVYSLAVPTGTISSPSSGGTQGAWTGAAGAAQFGDMAEYDLAVTGLQAIEYIVPSSTWSATAIAFSFTASAPPGGATTTTYYLGIFSKDLVLAVGAFDMGIPIRYGLYDDDFVAQFSGTAKAIVTQVAAVPYGVFDRDATLIGLYGAN